MSDLDEVDLSALKENDEGEQQVDDYGLIAELCVALLETI
jgi:hypothetical protein